MANWKIKHKHIWEKQLPNTKVKELKKYEICKKCFTLRKPIYNSEVRNWKYNYKLRNKLKKL